MFTEFIGKKDKVNREGNLNNTPINIINEDRALRHQQLRIKKKKADTASFMFFTYISSFVGISLITFLNEKLFSSVDLVLIIGSFGATAVIVYGLPESPLARPYNVIVGHFLSAIIGVTAYTYLGDTLWLSAAAAVSTAILAMQMTNSIHPPGGATALIAVIGSEKIHLVGYGYAIVPVGLGAVLLVFVAIVAKSIYGKKKKKLKKQFKSFF